MTFNKTTDDINGLINAGVKRISIRWEEVDKAWRWVIEKNLRERRYKLESEEDGLRVYIKQ